ncbi:MAG: hypothetical protein OD817_06320 [Gammaproteobacteria bacterium]
MRAAALRKTKKTFSNREIRMVALLMVGLQMDGTAFYPGLSRCGCRNETRQSGIPRAQLRARVRDARCHARRGAQAAMPHSAPCPPVIPAAAAAP